MVIGTFPRALQVDGADGVAFLVLVLDFKAATEFLREVTGEFFDHICHGFEVSKSLVGLKHGELRIVAARNTLVAEVTIELENLGKATHEQAFEKELRSDPQSEIHAESIVVGLKGAGGSTTGDTLQHRGLDLEIAALVKEAADFSNHFGAGDEDLCRVVITHQVEMALAVFGFPVSNSVPFVWHGTQGFAEHRELTHLDGWLAFTRGEGFALDTNPVTQIEQLIGGPVSLADTFFVEIDLDTAFYISNGGKNRFAHVPNGEYAPGNGHCKFVSEVSLELTGCGGGIKFTTIGINTKLSELGKLVTPYGDKFGLGRLGCSGGRGWLVAHGARSIGANPNNSRA